MRDPLHPDPVRPTDGLPEPQSVPEDARPFWLRLFCSVRPTATIETNKKTGKYVETVGLKAHADF